MATQLTAVDLAASKDSLVIVVFSAALTAITLLLIVRPIYRQKQIEAAQWQ
jgi:hypothetical protein